MARRNVYRGRYKLTKHEYMKAYHYAMCYNLWADEYAALADTAKAINYDDMPRGHDMRDVTAEAAERRVELYRKISLIQDTVKEAEPSIAEDLLFAVTNEGVTFEYLQTVRQMPCGKDMYYDRRRRFYYLLNKKI